MAEGPHADLKSDFVARMIGLNVPLISDVGSAHSSFSAPAAESFLFCIEHYSIRCGFDH